MEIRQIDVHDDAAMHAGYLTYQAADTFERPEAAPYTEAEWVTEASSPDQTTQTQYSAAYDGDRFVGVSLLRLPLLDNTDKCWLQAYVAPEERRRGIGGALVDHLVTAGSAAGRTTLLASINLPFDRRHDHPYRRFVEKHGFLHASTEVVRRLTLPVPDQQIQAWLDHAAPRHLAYRIETYVGPVPEAVLPSFCHVQNQLAAEAPSGAVEYEAEAVTPEAWREEEATLEKMARVLVNTVALDTAGDAVGVSTIAVPSPEQRKAFQWATIVLTGHRGHRLGLAMKAANLRELQRGFAGYERVYTANNETNSYMVSINETIGFVAVELSGEFQCKVMAGAEIPLPVLG